MANPEHLKILQKGVSEWNKWRTESGVPEPTFQFVDLKYSKLSGVNLSGAKLSGAVLGLARLNGADLSRADLSEANLRLADLSEAKFSGAVLRGAVLGGAVLSRADLSGADLSHAELSAGHLSGADLGGAEFDGAVLENVTLNETNFAEATFRFTVFANSDLSKTIGLESARHRGLSTIGIDTLFRSHGKIPDEFLRNAGVSEDVITHLMPLIRAGEPIQWHSCFISYSTKDDKFAERLHSRMRQAKLRVWFAPEDMKGGDYFFEQIERAIRLHDRLLLVLSEDSIQSKWVEREIRRARKTERAEKRRKFFPIRLVDMDTLKKWECLDHDTGEDLAEEVRKYHIPDFSNWKNHDAFETAFAKLHADLKASTKPPR